MKNTSLVIVNANVITLDVENPTAEAIYVENDRILSVGTNEDIRSRVTCNTCLYDLNRRTVVPGLVDCHVHMTSFGNHLTRLDLTGVGSIKELQTKLSQYARKTHLKKWIIGRRWDQEKFLDHRYPTREDLDAAVSDKPVWIIRVCGHLGVANTLALNLARINEKTLVEGGKIELDRHGHPNGVLKENAVELVSRAVSKQTNRELRSAFQLACAKAVQNGLTGVHWLVDSAQELRILQELRAENRLPLRVYLGITANLLDYLTNLGMKTGFGDTMLRIGFVKIFADGSLGAHTAALKEPYNDDTENAGMLLYSQKQLNDLIMKAHKAGLQVGTHAIGDRAIASVIKAYKNALRRNPRKNHRHRIEHYSVLDDRLISESNKLGILASVQPHFIVSDYWIKTRIGEERARMAYPFKTLMRRGLLVVSGSDCPIEDISPLLGIWAASSQQPYAEENLTVLEALKTYTSNAAYASFDEKERGIIRAGNLADLTVLSRDLFKVKPSDIRKIRVEMTIVGGKIVYSKN
jgi:predicted amidohydrolase YtcJ